MKTSHRERKLRTNQARHRLLTVLSSLNRVRSLQDPARLPKNCELFLQKITEIQSKRINRRRTITILHNTTVALNTLIQSITLNHLLWPASIARASTRAFKPCLRLYPPSHSNRSRTCSSQIKTLLSLPRSSPAPRLTTLTSRELLRSRKCKAVPERRGTSSQGQARNKILIMRPTIRTSTTL